MTHFGETVGANLRQLSATLVHSLIVLLLVAVATLLAAQLLKLPLRIWCYRVLLRRWLRSKEHAAQTFAQAARTIPSWLRATRQPNGSPEVERTGLPKPAVEPTGLPKLRDSKDLREYFSQASPLLSRDLYMKQIQNLVQQVLEHPSDHFDLFPYVAHGASVEDEVVAYHVDDITRKDPAFLARLKAAVAVEAVRSRNFPLASGGPAPTPAAATSAEGGPEQSYADAIATAQDNVAAAAERNLDDLQIQIALWWPLMMRTLAVVLGMIIAVSAGFYLAAPAHWTLAVLLAIIGVGAGYTASLAYDALAILGRLGSR